MSAEFRSQRLKQKLAEVALARTSKELYELLSSIEEIEWLGYSEGTELPFSPQSFWKPIIKIDAEPSAKIPNTVLKPDMALWLKDCLQQSNIGSSCYISVGRYNQLPWVKIRVQEGGDWLLTLWDRNVHEFIILSDNQNSLLGITQEEYYYFAYMEDLCNLPI